MTMMTMTGPMKKSIVTLATTATAIASGAAIYYHYYYNTNNNKNTNKNQFILYQDYQPKIIVTDPPSPIKSETIKTQPNSNDTNNNELITKHGIPVTHQLQYKRAYISEIDFRTKQPAWVLEHLSSASFAHEEIQNEKKSVGDRDGVRFTHDLDLPEPFRAQNSDYWSSGWSRGHMCAASNSKSLGQEALEETFLLSSNIVPQNLDNNVYYWNRLEIFTRDIVKERMVDDVWILSGPAYLSDEFIDYGYARSPFNPRNNKSKPSLDEKDTIITIDSTFTNAAPSKPKAAVLPSPLEQEQTSTIKSNAPTNNVLEIIPPFFEPYAFTPTPAKGTVSYPVIGSTLLPVPTHLFKSVLAYKQSTNTYYLANFLIPNGPIDQRVPLSDFKVADKSHYERLIGMRIFPDLKLENKELCRAGSEDGLIDCELITPYVHYLHGLTRNISSCEKRWKRQQESKLNPEKDDANNSKRKFKEFHLSECLLKVDERFEKVQVRDNNGLNNVEKTDGDLKAESKYLEEFTRVSEIV